MLTKSEVFRLVNDYIGVQGGYLGDFSRRTHAEFYPYYCDLDDLNVDEYEGGTTRYTFINILEKVDPISQAKIIRGIFRKYPVAGFSVERRDSKQLIHDEFQAVIERLENTSHLGVSGEIKNLIFAANGPKPELVLSDATTNEIRIVRNQEYCLVYQRQISERGLVMGELIAWWNDLNDKGMSTNSEGQNSLYARLKESLGGNEAEELLFSRYYHTFWPILGERLPALIPQVYLHYDPYTWNRIANVRNLIRQRMDFLILLPYRRHIVIEIDGRQHYSQNDRPHPRLYAEMMAEDRRLRLAGYEVYRFGGYEFVNPERARESIDQFFHALLNRHKILDAS